MRKLIPLLCVLLAGCIFDSSSTPTMSGIWEGDIVIGEVRIQVEYVVSQTGSEISGIGNITDTFGSIPLSVEGIVQHPQVRLRGSSVFGDIMYSGEFDTKDRLTGFLIFFGWDLPLVLERM